MSRTLRDRKPGKNTVDFLAEAVAGLRASGQPTKATDLERCFRYSDSAITMGAAMSAIGILTEREP